MLKKEGSEMVVRRMSLSQIKSEMRRIENNQKRAINNLNREINNYNRAVKKAVNNYNAAVRKHNENVRRTRQIINNELRKLNTRTTILSNYSISSRIMQQYYEEVERIYYRDYFVTPEQEKVFDLVFDLIEKEQANSLITENYIEGDSIPEEYIEDIEIGNKLALISEDLNNRWKGAVFALNPKNPDATRHFCTSTREIFTEFLEIKAPDKAVFAYNPQCSKTDRGNATRREKIKYLMRNLNANDSIISYVEEDIKNILELNQLLSGGTHGPAGKFTYEKLLQVKKRVEQGINFLCEISLLAM
ncbi:MAG: hypothetical protein IJV46_05370 [Acidaminococcaceae bacterium]|nr:hypothetical protein [Acidaminococcaceae bacterium]